MHVGFQCLGSKCRSPVKTRLHSLCIAILLILKMVPSPSLPNTSPSLAVLHRHSRTQLARVSRASPVGWLAGWLAVSRASPVGWLDDGGQL